MSRFDKISKTECEWSRDEDAQNGPDRVETPSPINAGFFR